MSKAVCVACSHKIDDAAKVCPYCGADPRTGQKVVDNDAIMQEIFKPREVSAGESVMEYARQRQGVVVGVTALVVFGILAALHWFVTSRNQSAVSAAPAVSLTEVADLSNQPQETTTVKMPELNFQYEGRPQSLKTYILEPNPVTPPEVIAAQQAAAAEAAAKAAPPVQTPPTGAPVAGQTAPAPAAAAPAAQAPPPPTRR